MTAGQVWRRPDGLHWVEVQAETMEPSGWRLMVPLVAPGEAAEAPPLVITAGRWRARVHLLLSASSGHLGAAKANLDSDDLALLQSAARRLLGNG